MGQYILGFSIVGVAISALKQTIRDKKADVNVQCRHLNSALNS